MRLRFKTRLFLILLAFALTPMGILGYFGLARVSETLTAGTMQSLEGLATAKAGAIDQFTDQKRSSVERIAMLVAPELAKLPTPAPPEEVPPEPRPKLKDAEDRDPEEPLESAGPAEGAPTASASASAGTGAPPAGTGAPSAIPDPPPTPSPPPSGALGPDGEPELSPMNEMRRTLGLILWDQREFEELLVTDPQGNVLVSTHEPHEGKTAADLEYIKAGRAATFLQPVFLSPITEQLTMVISTPIRDREHQLIGVLAARLNLKPFFSLIADATGLGKTGETVVGRAASDDGLLFTAPTRHDPKAALGRRLDAADESFPPLREGARGRSGSGASTDYRGEDVLAAWRPLQSLDWGLVVKLDKSEAEAPLTAIRTSFFILAGLLVLGVLIATVVVSSQVVRPLNELQNATERISKGDVNVQLAIPPGDEFGDLADSFERMVAAIKFFRERAERPADDIDAVDEESRASHDPPPTP